MANDLETRVLDLIGEDSSAPDVYDDTGIIEIRDLVNDAIEEVCMVTGCRQTVWHIPLKDGCFFYKVPGPDAFGWPVAVWLYGSKRKLEQKDFSGFLELDSRWLSSTGGPWFYSLLGTDKLCVFPAPAGDADSLEVTGVAIPARYETDTDKVDLRESYQWSVVHRVVSEWWAMRGDARTAMYHWQQYVDKIKLPAFYPENADRRWKYNGGRR